MKNKDVIVEGIAAKFLIPIVLLYRLISLVILLAFIASPLILIGWLIWAVTNG